MTLDEITHHIAKLESIYQGRLNYLTDLDTSVHNGQTTIDLFDSGVNAWCKDVPIERWRTICLEEAEKLRQELLKYQALAANLQQQLEDGIKQIQESGNEPTHLVS